MLKALLMVCIPFVVGGYLLSGPILTAFTTPEMAEQGVRILPLVALALTIHGCKVVVSQTFCLEKRTKPMGGTYTLAAVANAVLTIALIPVWGIEGAAVATVAAYSLDFLATLRFATRELFPWPGWGSVAKIGTSTAIMAGAVILAGRATPSGLVVPLAAGVAAYGICVRALYVLDADERALLRSIMPGRGDAANNGGRIAIFGGQLERTDEFLAIKMRRFSEKVGADVYSASIGLGWRFTRRSGRYTLLNTTPYYRKTPVIGFLNKAWGFLAFKAWGRKYGTIVLPGGIESPLIKVFGASRCVPFVVGTIEDAQSLARARAVVPTLKGVIAETQASKRQLEELGLAPERIHVMTPMIDPAHLQPYPPPSEGPFYILFASSPVHTHTLPGRYHSKGVSLLLEAFSLLAETRDVRLTLVWRKDFLHELEEDIAKYGIGDKVAVADELVDMKEYYRSHHCVVIPYTDSAGGPHLPLSALEALGHGRPVVATGVEDLQAIADLGCGTIADDITPVALRNALAACMDNYAELQARTRVCSSSLLDEHKKKYTAVRTFLLSLPRGTRVEKKKTVKVAFVHASAIKNSRFIEERGAALMDRGHGVAFIGWNRYHDAPYTFGAAHIWRFQVPTPLDSPSYFLFLPIWWAWSLCRLLWYRPDAVVAVNADAVPPSIAYALLARRQLVHDLHDFYFYHFANKPAPIPQIVDLLTYQAIKRSSLIITISEEAIEDFISRHCIDTNTNKIMNYPCLPTPGELDILHHKELSRYESFTACFFGNISRDRYVREIIEAVCEVPKCGFLLAGPEMKKGALSECLELMEYCSSMEYLGYLMRDELLELTARCHCIVLLLDPTNPHHRIPVPNKMYEGVVCHTPVITTEGTSSADMVHRYGMGLVISDNSSATIAGALKSLSQDHHLWESCVEGCLKAERDIVGNYSFEETIEALEEVARRGG
jgi:glycosyltransferase involved in cell wall biosynthesis